MKNDHGRISPVDWRAALRFKLPHFLYFSHKALLYLCQTIKLCQDRYEKLKYSGLLLQSLRNKIKDYGIGLLEKFVGNWSV